MAKSGNANRNRPYNGAFIEPLFASTALTHLTIEPFWCLSRTRFRFLSLRFQTLHSRDAVCHSTRHNTNHQDL